MSTEVFKIIKIFLLYYLKEIGNISRGWVVLKFNDFNGIFHMEKNRTTKVLEWYTKDCIKLNGRMQRVGG